MAKIYFINAQGKKVSVEVSEEIAKQYRESLREEWRGDAYEKYYTKSLDGIIEAGSDFEDKSLDVEETIIKTEQEHIKNFRLKNLHKAMDSLLPEQRELLSKIYFGGVTQREIAEQEGIDESAISKRMERIYKRLKKIKNRPSSTPLIFSNK